MSDFVRMAQMHRIDFDSGKPLTHLDVAQFLRNQKYSERVIGPFKAIGAELDPELAAKYASFVELSDKLRNQTTTLAAARLLEAHYKVSIVDANDVVDFKKLAQAMQMHQTIQLTEALPKMMGSVTKSEVFKISEWLKSASGNDRLTLRKQMALTYAPLTDGQRATIIAQVDKLTDIPEADKAFVRRAMDQDAKQIRRYADLLELKASTLSGQLKLRGDNHAVVDFIIDKNTKVRRMCDAMASRPGGSRFQQFLKSKTARALNMDTMLDFSKKNKGAKMMQWSMMLLAATRAYQGASDEKEGLKQMGIAVFYMIPFMASALRFSEDEYREAFKEFAMDIFPPLALANLVIMGMEYVADEAKEGWDDTVWDGLVREAMRDLNDDDFEKTDMGYYRLKERESYFEYIKEIAPGMGRVAKLASMVAPEVEAMMSRNEEVKINLHALYNLQWFEKFNEESQSTYWAKQFDIQQIKNRVWNEGAISKGSGTPVERMAGKLILNNLAIRLQMQDKVLSKFIDKIEKRYNDLKGEVTGDCSDPGTFGELEQVNRDLNSGVINSIRTGWGDDAGQLSEEECNANAIIMETMAMLKTLYENAPSEIKESNWADETLQEEYSRILGYLKDYKPVGMSELALRKEMQEIVDAFKAFIEDLVFGVALYEEAQTLNLTAHIYGGDNEHEETDVVLLGDSFRVGMSARVSPIHAGERTWKVFYYAIGPEDVHIKKVGSVSLSSQKYNPGAEGLWLIEDPDKDTLYHIRRGDIRGNFDVEGPYQLSAVLAFGSWSDPVSEVGYEALRNPIEFAQFFTPDKVAFASSALNFIVKRAELKVKPKKEMFPSSEIPDIEYYISAPAYAASKTARADFNADPIDEESNEVPECYPETSDEVSFDKEQPSKFSVVISPDADQGKYLVGVSAEIEGLAEEFQPIPQVVKFEHFKSDDDESTEDKDGQLAQLEELQKRSQALLEKASSNYKMVENETSDALKTLKSLDKDLRTIDKLIKSVDKRAGAVDDNLALTKKDADQAQIEAEKAASNRSEVQNYALSCCEAADRVKQTIDVDRLKQLIKNVRLEDEQTRSYKKDFDANIKTAGLAKAEAVEIKDSMLLLRGDRTQVAKQLAQIENVLGVVKSDVERLEQLSSIISEATVELATVRVQADAIINGIVAMNQKKKISKTLTPEDKEFAKTAGRIAKTIASNEKKAIKLDKKGKSKISKPASKLSDLIKEHKRITESAQKLIEMPDVSDETFLKFEKNAKDAQVAYDSAEIFVSSVDSSAQQSATCLQAAEKHFAIETSPEAQVAKKDCRPWPGTTAKWVESKKTAECWCPENQVWDEGNNQCVSKRDHEWARTNCNHAPGTSKVWNEKKQIVECQCPRDQRWDGKKCVVIGTWPPKAPGGGSSGSGGGGGAQDLIKGLQDLMTTIQGGGGNNGGGGSGGGGTTRGGGTGTGGGGSSTGGNADVNCAAPGWYDEGCITYCRCPDGSFEAWGQGCN